MKSHINLKIHNNLKGCHGTAFIIRMYFFHLPPTSSHLHPLQVENCDSNSRLVVDGDGKFRLEMVKCV